MRSTNPLYWIFSKLNYKSTYNTTMFYYKKMRRTVNEQKRLKILYRLIEKLKNRMNYSFVCNYVYGTDFYEGDWDKLYSDLEYYSDRFCFQRLNKIATFTLKKNLTNSSS